MAAYTRTVIDYLDEILTALGGGSGATGTKVQGMAAAGTPVTGNPIQVGVSDGTNIQYTRAVTSSIISAVGVPAVGPMLRTTAGNASAWFVASSLVDADNAGSTAPVITWLFNGATFDRQRAANAASNTTGTGLLGAGLLAFDGTNYQLLKVDTAANPNLRVSLFQGASQVDTATAANDTVGTGTRGLATAAFPLLYNGASWDRLRSPGLGTLAGGRFRIANKATPTVGTGTAYALGDVIGVKNTIASAARISGGSGIIMGVTVSNKSGVADPALALRVWYFDSDPSGSTFTDNAALTIVDADITKCIGFVDLPGTGGTAVNNEVWCNKSLDLHFVASGSSSIFMVLEARGAVAANAGTTDWQISTFIEQD